MRLFKKEVWAYAVLLVVLFSIASIAVYMVIDYLSAHVTGVDAHIVAILLWSLTLGFMAIAGAFGLWTIQLTGERETRRQLVQLVEAMNSLQDGLVAVDHGGRITASNPAAGRLGQIGSEPVVLLADAFPALCSDDIEAILKSPSPQELERTRTESEAGAKTLRFRSHPLESFVLVFVSDVTLLNIERTYRRQKARLQLIGYMARGVANDFNTLMVGMSSYASLLSRLPRASAEFDRSIAAIEQQAQKGAGLAGQLLALAQPGMTGSPTDLVSEHAKAGAELLLDALPAGWQMDISSDPRFPTTSFSGLQIEQIVLNLGLLVTESSLHPGIVCIAARQQAPALKDRSSPPFAGMITVRLGPATADDSLEPYCSPASAKSGIILSVVRSLVEGTGGTLEWAADAERITRFRVLLPMGTVAAALPTGGLNQETAAIISNWSVLIASGAREGMALNRQLAPFGVRVKHETDLVSILSSLDGMRELDAILLDRHLVHGDAAGLLRALVKLRPACGIVVMTDAPEETIPDVPEGVICVWRHDRLDRIVSHMVEAKSLSLTRNSAGRIPETARHEAPRRLT